MEILDKLKVSRRHALRGMLSGVGVAMWLPVLDIMCNENGTAFAQGAPLPTTFGIFCWGNGIHPGTLWTPTTTGDGTAWQLPPNLSDFSDLKDAMTLVTGLDMLDYKFKGHGWGTVYVLAGGDGFPCVTINDIFKSPYGGLPETAQGTQWQPTIDQIIADAIHTTEPYKSLETGIIEYTGQNMGTASANLAHRGPNMPLAPQRDPATLFNNLFSKGAPPTSSTALPIDVSNKLRRSVLDAVLSDANRLQASLGSNDAKRIAAHMDSVRSLEMRIPTTATGTGGGTGSSTCQTPATPTAQAANLDLTMVTATSQAMNKLIAAALACNMTRVYTHLWSGGRDDNHYPIIMLDTQHHELTHMGGPTSPQNLQAAQIEKYIMSQYADLARNLKGISMGASTLLDNTLLYGITELGEPSGHIMTNYHIVLMGHAGGKLPGNRHYRAPGTGTPTGRKVTELMLTLQQVMGMKVTTYGSWDKTSKTMPEILA
ncbi:MAG TPA: DUF1552 domain-containing protein, partial [Vicinamibacterales bacterium]|nr:DUF1552 domain-containing protein [Vicinamibacterales bacterium]